MSARYIYFLPFLDLYSSGVLPETFSKVCWIRPVASTRHVSIRRPVAPIDLDDRMYMVARDLGLPVPTIRTCLPP